MGRGRERLVRCEKCGREVRRDKAVFIEKPVFQNPLERKDVYSETYNRVLTREVSYCISCGKHGRIFQKKIQQLQKAKERAQFNRFKPQGAGPHYSKPYVEKPKAHATTQTAESPTTPSQPQTT